MPSTSTCYNQYKEEMKQFCELQPFINDSTIKFDDSISFIKEKLLASIGSFGSDIAYSFTSYYQIKPNNNKRRVI